MNIWIPKCKIIEPKRELVVSSRVQGHWKLEGVNKYNGHRRRLAEFPNLIVDSGLNIIGTISGWMAVCRVGSGNTAPANGNTTLQTEIATTSTEVTAANGSQGSAPYYGWTTRTFRFGEGVAEGNIAEIGISTSAPVLFSRALILDDVGSPTTITVLDDEFLDATYEIRIYPPLVDVLDTIDISGTDYDLTIRAAEVTATQWAPGGGFHVGSSAGFTTVTPRNGVIGAITATPAGTGGTAVSASNAAYSNGSLQRDATATWGLTEANIASGIRSILARYGLTTGGGGLGSMQCQFDPAIPKTSSDVLSLSLRHSWARGTI